MADYFKETYERWYSGFSHLYDPFMKVMFFLSNGGFGGELRIRESVIECVDPRPGEKILDLGSGTGTLAIMIGESLAGYGEVVGVEISQHQFRIANRKVRPSNVRFIKCDARHTHIDGGYFDKCVVFGVLHELPHDVRLEVLVEAMRVLKHEGTLVSFEHNVPRRKWLAILQDISERLNPEYRTFRDLIERGLAEEIELAGFDIVRTETKLHDMAQLVLAQKPKVLS